MEVTMENKYIESEIMNIKLEKEYSNKSILDIGGGGEGFIGLLYGRQVIAIDKRQDELNETVNDAIKLVMDGTDLAFLDESFEVVTLFYSLMYMSQVTRKKVLSEAYRVLKSGGIIETWDIELPRQKNDGKTVFVAQLSVECNDKITATGYGVGLNEDEQTYQRTKQMLEDIGFVKLEEDFKAPSFRLKYRKQ